MLKTEIINAFFREKGDSQMDIVQEELAELIQAVSKYRRGRKGSFDKEIAVKMLIEEIADVEICIEQIKNIVERNEGTKIDQEILNMKEFKMDRLFNRIKANRRVL